MCKSTLVRTQRLKHSPRVQRATVRLPGIGGRSILRIAHQSPQFHSIRTLYETCYYLSCLLISLGHIIYIYIYIYVPWKDPRVELWSGVRRLALFNSSRRQALFVLCCARFPSEDRTVFFVETKRGASIFMKTHVDH